LPRLYADRIDRGDHHRERAGGDGAAKDAGLSGTCGKSGDGSDLEYHQGRPADQAGGTHHCQPQREAAQLEAGDPMQWLAEKPANYAGAYRQPAERDNWYYDERRRELAYVVNSGDFLEIEATDGQKQIRFRIQLLADYLEFGGTRVKSVTGVTLVPVRPYRWLQPVPGGELA